MCSLGHCSVAEYSSVYDPLGFELLGFEDFAELLGYSIYYLAQTNIYLHTHTVRVVISNNQR